MLPPGTRSPIEPSLERTREQASQSGYCSCKERVLTRSQFELAQDVSKSGAAESAQYNFTIIFH